MFETLPSRLLLVLAQRPASPFLPTACCIVICAALSTLLPVMLAHAGGQVLQWDAVYNGPASPYDAGSAIAVDALVLKQAYFDAALVC